MTPIIKLIFAIVILDVCVLCLLSLINHDYNIYGSYGYTQNGTMRSAAHAHSIHSNYSNYSVLLPLQLHPNQTQSKINKTQFNINHDTNSTQNKNSIRSATFSRQYLITSLNYGSPYKKSSAKAIENQQCYATKNNYTYQVFDEHDLHRIESNYFNQSAPFCNTRKGFKAYYKAFVLHHIFNHPSYKSFEYILFVDHDLLFTNHGVTIGNILTKARKVNQNAFGIINTSSNETNPISFVFSRRGRLINSGIMLFKNTKFMKDMVDTWYNITIDICVHNIEWGGNNFPDQTIISFILKGGNYTDWQEHVMNHLNDTNQVTHYTQEWGRPCLNKHFKMGRGTANEGVMRSCVHKRFHPHIAILDYHFFNCIEQSFNSCKQFVIHFAGNSMKERLIDRAVNEMKRRNVASCW